MRLNSVYAAGTTQDGIQLFNSLPYPVDARAWYVSDGTVIDPIFNGTGVDGTIGSELGRELRQNQPSSFTFSLDFNDVLYLYDATLVRLDQIGWHRIPAYFPDSCIVRVPTAAGPADGYDWATSGGGVTLFYLDCPLMEGTVDVGENTARVSGLGRPIPNPAREAVALSFTLASAGRERVRIGIYDVSGRRVRVLGEGNDWGPGTHTVHWDGRDRSGRRATAGVYFARMVVSGRPVGESRSIVWLRP